MKPDSSPQLEKPCFGNAEQSFEFTFQPPPLSSLSSTSTIPILPPEVLSQIFEIASPIPSTKRLSTLSSLCLVNCYFRDLAQPILYREVDLYLEKDVKTRKKSFKKLCSTLRFHPGCSKLVRSLRLSLEMFDSEDMNKLGKIVGRLSRLETIRTNWSPPWKRVKPEIVEDLIAIVRKNGNRIKSLELPYFRINPSVLKSLPNLKTFVGALSLDDLPSPSISSEPKRIFNSQCRLQRLVFNRPLYPTSFNSVVKPFENTLTSLSIIMNPDSGSLDLSSFSHLTILRLVISDIRNLIFFAHANFLLFASITDTTLFSNNFIKQIRQTLESVQDLSSIRSLTLAASTSEIADYFSGYPLLDLLPQSLTTLSTFPQLLQVGENREDGGEGGNLNCSILLDSLESHQLPHLTRIDILPSTLVGGGQADFKMTDALVRSQFEKLCRSRSLKIEVNETRMPKVLNRGLALDPNRAEYESEDQDGRDEREKEISGGGEERHEEEKEVTKPSFWIRLRSLIRRLVGRIC
ncbi:hypothetical protein JCM3765_000091 [Sporobolomyces pararoseus]